MASLTSLPSGATSTLGASALRWTTRIWASSATGAGLSVRTTGVMLASSLVAATVVSVPPSKVSGASMTTGPSSREAPAGTTWIWYVPAGTYR